MTTAVIITLVLLLLIAYAFDLTASRTRIPSVILLLALGWLVRQVTGYFSVALPDLSAILPILGTIGLILIVLEGSLELELNRSKLKLIRQSLLMSLLPLFTLAFALAGYLHGEWHYPLVDALHNVIPLCIISSAIAIPSVRNLDARQKEFTIYESSLSDIFGVIFFNFVLYNTSFGLATFGRFGLEMAGMLLISLAATIGLSFLLSRISHPIKFAPIVLLVILIYEVSKVMHLPALLFILLFGLAIGNLDELDRFAWIRRFRPDELNREVHKFKELVIEGTFLIRALFFLLFGYLIQTRELLDTSALLWSVSIVTAIFLIRALMLWICRLPVRPLVFVAPRGLITILLFLSIPAEKSIPFLSRPVIIQVILLTALIMMVGLMTTNPQTDSRVLEEPDAELP
ncbi:MAG TPA: hypothetical protein VG842_10200 [Sediminibacterium sp.]|nr:hypothetical protein [Sediminibacterium sp.]